MLLINRAFRRLKDIKYKLTIITTILGISGVGGYTAFGDTDVSSKASTLLESLGSNVGLTSENQNKYDNLELARCKEENTMYIIHKSYSLLYSKEYNCPLWVAWELTDAETYGEHQRTNEFLDDPKIPSVYRVTTNDYRHSGYDRGHMCPAADNKWSADAMTECFYMSNMCPQTHTLNAESWEKLEDKCRQWARAYRRVFICCGPIFEGHTHEKIGIEHSVSVPEGYFKVVLDATEGREKAIGFIYRNNDDTQRYTRVCTSVDQVEEITGMDFFYNLEDNLEDRVEANYNIRRWI